MLRKALISYLHYYLGKSRLAGKLKEVINGVINIFHAQKELKPFPGRLGIKKNLISKGKKGLSSELPDSNQRPKDILLNYSPPLYQLS